MQTSQINHDDFFTQTEIFSKVLFKAASGAVVLLRLGLKRQNQALPRLCARFRGSDSTRDPETAAAREACRLSQISDLLNFSHCEIFHIECRLWIFDGNMQRLGFDQNTWLLLGCEALAHDI